MTFVRFRRNEPISILCDFCYNEISFSTRIKCSECNLDFCVLCFYNKKKLDGHDLSHKYRAIEPLVFPVYEPNWTALDELLFFDAFYIYGIGNWEDISNYFGSKSVEEIEKHFCLIFGISDNKFYESDKNISGFSNPNIHEVVNYLPLRKDFDVEYDNDAENIIKDLVFKEEDNEIEKQLKEAMIDSYFYTLKLRNIRKHIILDRNLYEIKKLQSKESNYSENEKKILSKLKPLTPYLSKTDFNSFLKGIFIEEHLKSLLNKNQDFKQKYSNERFLKYEKERSKLLTDLELEICKKLEISYKSYIHIKSTAINEFLKNNYLNVKRLKYLLKSYDKRIEVLYGFFSKQGWIPEN
ncbi:Myb-like transcription factor [Hamiltosporidium magnivora]|uniref:Myb-like transcription factor n=1 Tax=Hamiltosporidium magnivora TaxID=148818 RepID=A0A4V2JWW7_9MICR|nr:Myb-like transcription factor [Hamiltosporidium magnivora]